MLDRGYALAAVRGFVGRYKSQQTFGVAQFASCDDGWGPFAIGCKHGRFDFTLLFQQVFLTIVPSALFILGALVGICQLWAAKPVVKTTPRYYVKMVSETPSRAKPGSPLSGRWLTTHSTGALFYIDCAQSFPSFAMDSSARQCAER